MPSFLKISCRIFTILMVLAIFFVIYNLFEAHEVKKDASVNVSLVTPFFHLEIGRNRKVRGLDFQNSP